MKKQLIAILLLIIFFIPIKTFAENEPYIDEENWYFNDDFSSEIYLDDTLYNNPIETSTPKNNKPKVDLRENELINVQQQQNKTPTKIRRIKKQPRVLPVQNDSEYLYDRNIIQTQPNRQISSRASEIKIPAGTAVTVSVEREIDADDVQEGQNIDFIVLDPVTIDGTPVIKSGTPVIAQVINKKNNFIFGIPGELEVGNFKLFNQNNGIINLRGSILDKGTHRAWANIGWILVWPLLFIKGNDGKIPAGTFKILYTIGDSYFKVNDASPNYSF